MDVCLLMLLFVDTCLINMVGKVRIQWGWMGRLVATFQVCANFGDHPHHTISMITYQYKN